MTTDNAGNHVFSTLLRAAADGAEDAFDRLIAIVYDDLRGMAHNLLRHERDGHTLQPTALVHEAYARLVGAELPFESRAQFYSILGRTMRRVLVDHARGKARLKRGGNPQRVTLDTHQLLEQVPEMDVLDLDRALVALAEHDERKARAVELYYFTGLDLETAGKVLGVSAATVHRDLKMARAWILDHLTEGDN